MGRKKRNIQWKFRRMHFDSHRYWQISYTEKYPDGTEKDYRTFVRSKSYKQAKKILQMRLEEDEPNIKLKAIQGFMFHSDYRNDAGKKLGLKEWDQIRSSAFPNSSNTIFKFHVPRPEWKSNRFNATNYDQLKSIGFKKGEENWSTIHRKGKTLPFELRKGKIWTGHEWKDWDKHEMEKAKKRVISALILHDNNRTAAAQELGMHRNRLYKLMNRIVGVDWDTEYPIIRKAPPLIPKEQRSLLQKKAMAKRMANGEIPFGSLTEDQKRRKRENINKAFRRKREARLNDFIPKAKKALVACGNSRSKAADQLGIKRSYFSKMMIQTSDQVNWAEEFPNPYINKRCLQKKK